MALVQTLERMPGPKRPAATRYHDVLQGSLIRNVLLALFPNSRLASACIASRLCRLWWSPLTHTFFASTQFQLGLGNWSSRSALANPFPRWVRPCCFVQR